MKPPRYINITSSTNTPKPNTEMVCAKCQKKLKSTELATPGVKRKSEMYYGSPATSVGGGSAGGESKKSTLGNTGIGKVIPPPVMAYVWMV